MDQHDNLPPARSMNQFLLQSYRAHSTGTEITPKNYFQDQFPKYQMKLKWLFQTDLYVQYMKHNLVKPSGSKRYYAF